MKYKEAYVNPERGNGKILQGIKNGHFDWSTELTFQKYYPGPNFLTGYQKPEEKSNVCHLTQAQIR